MKAPGAARVSVGAALGARSVGMRDRIESARDPRHAIVRLFASLRPFRGRLALVCCLIGLYTLLGLIGPYLMGVAIDRFIALQDPAGLARISLAMLGAYLLHNLFHGLASWLMADVSQRAIQALRRELFSRLQRLPVSFFDTRPAGELMSRLTNDIEAVNQVVSQNVTALLAGALSLFGILAAMFILNVQLALASLLVVPLMFWFTRFVARYTRRGFRELQAHLGGLNAVMEEAISGQKVVQAFGRNASVLAEFRRCNEAVFHAAVRANSYAFLLMPLTNVLGNLFVIVLAGLGGWLALAGLVSVGTIATFISYAQNFISPLRQLANLYNAIQAALAGAERVFEIIDLPDEDAAEAAPPGAGGVPPSSSPSSSPAAVRGAVRFDRVSFAYRKETPVIREMSFAVPAGQTLALVGPTGAGKTTLINLLSRFYEIDGGAITVDGRDIRSLDRAELRRSLGVVPQDTFLFSGTVLENIRYGRLSATDEECLEAARLAGADPFVRQLPQGYRTLLAERAGNLSQGQRQLLAIARAILADPAILILDEATSSVDTRTEARIQRALLSLTAGRTSLVIAHRLSTIRDADQVLVIDAGRIVEQGRHCELLARRGLYHRLYVSQFKGQGI
jgi:ATP-binding cassette subfamily B protein